MNIFVPNIFKNKKVVITGGLGFVGSAIAIQMVHFDAKVILADAMKPDCGGNYHNVNEIKENVEIIEKDLDDEDVIHYLVKDADYIFNMASKTSHMDSLKDPIADMDSNIRIQVLLLEECKKNNKSVKIIYASTRQVYGKSIHLPANEMHPKQPIDINAINKLAGEEYHLFYNRLYGLDCTVFRLTNTYGPRMRIKDAKQNFLGVWIRNIVQANPIEVWGGEQIRDYNYIDDVVDAFILSATRKKTYGKVYNLGSTEIISLIELAKLCKKIDSDISINLCEFPSDRRPIDIGDFYSDIGSINQELGWSPKVMLYEGLQKTLEYYKNNLKYYL